MCLSWSEHVSNFLCLFCVTDIVLVAINLYEELPLYGTDIIAAYNWQPMRGMDSHVFAMVEDALRKMIE